MTRFLAPLHVTGTAPLAPALALMRASFAYMDGVIDPPTSLHRMTLKALAQAAQEGELWVIGPGPAACMILTPRADTLYLGKLAVAQGHRGNGLARRMVEHALHRARMLGLPGVTLQTRVELTGNHAAFQALGFEEIGRTAHPGYTKPTAITFFRPV